MYPSGPSEPAAISVWSSWHLRPAPGNAQSFLLKGNRFLVKLYIFFAFLSLLFTRNWSDKLTDFPKRDREIS